MYSIKIAEQIVLSSQLVKVEVLKPHEEVVKDRLQTLVQYLLTLKPYIIVPSILVCNKTNMIVDGHHRFYALQEMGFSKIPVTFINYQSKSIVADLEGKVQKETLLQAAEQQIMLPPKSSFHHIIDDDLHAQPLILLSVLFRLDYI